MPKSPEQLRMMGWERCEHPRAHLKFSSEEDVVCQDCGGKGWFYIWYSPWGQTMGQCYRKRCGCRGGRRTKVNLDPEFRLALEWFYNTKPPGEAFEFYQFKDVYKVIENPAAYWQHLKDRIGTRNIYAMEAIREDIMTLHQLFTLSNEEFS